MTSWVFVKFGSGNDLNAWQHQAITWTNVDLSSVWSCGIYLRTIPLEMFKISITKLHLKIKYSKSQPHLPEDNELRKFKLPSSLQYKTHFSRQLNCWSLRCSWSIACRRCSNYICILQLTLGFNILRKDNCKPRQETFKLWNLVPLV